MTRINLGVEPRELCDQHLVAEYRELPRLWKYAEAPPTRVPDSFRLGRGHVLWCAAHLGEMARRYSELVEEMRHRGFTVRFPDAPAVAAHGRLAPAVEVRRARPLVVERIQERLEGMAPRWTRRAPPAWAKSTNP